MYFILLVLTFILFYFILFNKNYNLSLFSSLLIFIFITILNYNYIYLLIPIILYFILNIFKVSIKKYISLFNFIILFYIFTSINELIAHRYVMHCDLNSSFSKFMKNIVFLNKQYFDTCEKHIQHHLEVNPNMSLEENKYKESLFMNWDIFLTLGFFTFICLVLSKYISQYDISFKYIIILTLILTFTWQYLWNKVHIKMHDYETDYSINDGPYDNGLLDLDFVKNLLYKNHQNHHLQKGKKKGNYNVILLGADEWFGYNNKKVDNLEYCKTHGNEKICK